jgi:hypothetical protein
MEFVVQEICVGKLGFMTSRQNSFPANDLNSTGEAFATV